jgi:hypothetical protein
MNYLQLQDQHPPPPQKFPDHPCTLQLNFENTVKGDVMSCQCTASKYDDYKMCVNKK